MPMCGLSGIISAAPVTPVQRATVAAMANILVHRGPDDEGWIEVPHAIMTMRRLAIIDIAGAAQPLASADRSLQLIFNGEIYNYRELRADLANHGHAFRTAGDGEVILALYERHGLDFVDHLRGMFAIALWDGRAKRVVLVRDPMGEKPLYLHETPGQLAFASEVKALLGSGAAGFVLDPAAVHLYFHYQYVPEPLTAVCGVRKLDAGHMLIVDLEPWMVHERRYWALADAAPIDGDPAVLIRERLEDAVSLSLRADVPVGIALSGGLDSSLIAALAAQQGADIAALTVGYPGHPPHDERRQAGALADALGMPFHDVELSVSEMIEAFAALNYWRDDPIADIAGFGYFAVMRKARELGIKVMLQGQGGDELFWGYGELRAARGAAHRAQRRQGGLWRRITGAREPAERLPLYEHAPDFRDAARNVARHYAPAFADAVRSLDPGGAFALSLPLSDVDVTLTEQVCATYLRENGIAQAERLAMASSVELRLPFMDRRLIEAVIGLRKCRSDGDLPAKAWLKGAVRDLLPDAVVDRAKQGFSPPVRAWHAALFERYGKLLADGYMVESEVLSPAAARSLAKGPFPSGAIAPLSFKALILEMWCRQMTRASP